MGPAPSSSLKTAVVTGASSGIGLVVARELARRGFRVIGLGRSPGRSKAALAEIRRAAPTAQVDFVRADLAVMSEVRRAATEITALTDRVDVLINNAGAVIKERRVTPDGYEATFAGNHLGPFLLTQCLMPLLRAAVAATGEARVVNTASGAHQMVRDMAWDDLQLEKNYGSWTAYAQSKLANILFTRELARRERENGIRVNAVHPGVVDTNFPSGGGLLTTIGWLVARPFAKTPEQGADSILWLATEAPADLTGGYLEQRQPARITKAAQSAEGARRLWELSERMTSVR
ncbi:SDR family oxidoreductase [Microvirga massiliensis]|uniref:SDR family oxidoreductase n=1 Tax=Microvirga massiliensis TaxID=1033741 RepID=UPI00062B7D3B|nr:SDR family oxidoreductase [Microvirga massiliensis]